MTARIGRKDYGKEPLPTSPWRRQIRLLAYWMLMAIFGLLWVGFLLAVVHA